MTDDRPAADGTIEQSPDGSTTVRFDRRLRHPIERVWQALTDPDELRRWWGDTKLDPVEGGLFQLRWRNTDENGRPEPRCPEPSARPTALGWRVRVAEIAAEQIGLSL
jgi:activator of Hsp90 ATPase-like protein